MHEATDFQAAGVYQQGVPVERHESMQGWAAARRNASRVWASSASLNHTAGAAEASALPA